MAKKEKGINPKIEKAINDLLEQVMKDPEASLTDKMKVLDRALNLEKIKQKVNDEDWGTGFVNNDEDDEPPPTGVK